MRQRHDIQERGPKYPAPKEFGLDYDYFFVENAMFDRMAHDGNLDIFEGGYLAQDPTLEADIGMIRQAFDHIEYHEKKRRGK